MVLNHLLSILRNPLTAVGVVFLLLYYETIVRVAKNMFTYQGSHGILIMAVSLYMVWVKRSRLREAIQKPQIGFGVAVTMAGCFILICGKVGNILILQELSLPITLSGLILLLLGSRYFWILFLPIAYLLIMFPVFDNIIGSLSFYLQLITATIASSLLNLKGIPTYQSGIHLELPYITLSVARVCNGINHIMALVAISIPLSFITHQSIRRKILFVFGAFLFGILSNGLRVALIGIWARHHQGSLLHGPFDMLYVAFIFFFGLVVIFLLGFISRDKPLKSPLTEQAQAEALLHSSKKTEEMVSMPFNLIEKSVVTKKPTWKEGVITLGIILGSLTFLRLWSPLPYSLTNPLSELPEEIAGWVGRDISREKGTQSLQPGDWILQRIYQSPSGHKLEVEVIYYSYQNQNREITDFRYKWEDWPVQTVQIQLKDQKVKVKKAEIKRKDSVTRAYFWYDINGRILLNHYTIKGAVILDGLTKRRTSGSWISIQANSNLREDENNTEDEEIAFIQDMLTIMREHFKQQYFREERL